MGADGLRGDEQRPADLVVRPAVRNQPQDLPLALGERGRRGVGPDGGQRAPPPPRAAAPTSTPVGRRKAAGASTTAGWSSATRRRMIAPSEALPFGVVGRTPNSFPHGAQAARRASRASRTLRASVSAP